MAIETLWPLRAVASTSVWRWINNLALTAVDYAVLLGISPWLALLVVNLVGIENPGLLHKAGASPWVSFVVLLFSLQFAAYWLHRAFHAFPVLWRIHTVHHCDPEVDATTANRHHPLEPILNAVAMLPVVVILGPDPISILGYNILAVAVAVMSHGNFTFGPRLDGLLRRFIVTPDFHRMHHSSERQYTDSNYATVLPVFDYLFRTATRLPTERQKTMQLGLPYFRETRFARLDQMLFIPFMPRQTRGPQSSPTRA
jgi:sterol desaturase/sphingolipid hydroxylase (fatty acid hydroxylase superfamily)